MTMTQDATGHTIGAAMDLSPADFARGAFAQSIGISEKNLLIGLDVARQMSARGAKVEALRMHAMLALCLPSNVELQIGLAEIALDLGLDEIAMQAASVAVALAPSDPRGYLLSGRSAIGMEALAEAREDLAEASRLAKEAGRGDIVAEAARLAAGIS